MRNLKRIFSLCVMAAMLCGVMAVGVGAAYKDFADKDEITHATAVETLVSLGIINGKEDGSYYEPTGILTRGEAAKLICVVLNGGKAPVLGNPGLVSYQDTVDCWVSPYIEYCTSLGIVAGDGQGYFRPNNTVTASQLSKMLLVALGYDADHEGLVGSGWAVKTDALANQAGLYSGLSNLVTGQVLNRDNAARIIYNVLIAGLVSYASADNNINSKATSTGQTVLERYFSASEVVGTIVSNDIFSVCDNAAYNAKCADGRTRIKVETVNGVEPKDDAYPVYTLNVSNELVGQKIILYVKNYGKTTAAVVGSPVVSSSNKVVTTYKEYSNTEKLTDFLTENHLTLPKKVYSYRNGVLLGRGEVNTIRGTMGNGIETRFIDNNGDGIVDLALLTEYALTKITSYNTSGKTMGLVSVNGTIDFDDVANYVGYTNGDYVLYVDFNGTYYLSNVNTVSGAPTRYTSNSKLVIGGTEYAASALANETNYALDTYLNDNTYVNNNYIFYLDSQGNIIAVSDHEETSQNYALILASNAEKGTLSSCTGTVKLLKDDGSVSAYTVNLTDSADKYLNYENNAIKLLDYKENGTAQSVTASAFSTVKQTGMAALLANGLNSDVNKNNGGWIKGDGTALKGMVVTFSVNSDGTVTIGPTTAYDKADNIGEDAIKTNASYTYDGESVAANGNTIYFFSNGDATSVVKGLGNLAPVANGAKVIAVAYSQSGSGYVAKAVYVKGVSGPPQEDNVYVIGEPEYYTNADGKAVKDFTVAYSNGKAGKVSVLEGNAASIVKGSVYGLSYKDGYAVLKSDNNIYNNATVNYAGNGTVKFTYVGGTKTLSAASDVTVVSVKNADDSLSNVTTDTVDSIFEGAKIAVSINGNQIQHIYIIDYYGDTAQ